MKPILLLGVTLAVAGCTADLDVPNENEPDRERVLEEPSDVETLIGGSFNIWMRNIEWCAPDMPLSAAADETTVSWGNCGLQQMSQEPRVEWPNDPAFGYGWVLRGPWNGMYEVLASLRDALIVLDTDSTGRYAQETDVPRARAFARFMQGLAHAYLAMLWDSAFVWDEKVDIAPGALQRQPYPDVLQAALGYFDDAIDLASGADWALDPSWMPGAPLSTDQFVGLVHGYKARYMSQVARTPPERAALDWGAIVAEVDNNLGEDFWIVSDPGALEWWHSLQWFGEDRSSFIWNRADYKLVGYTDTSGRYDAWLDADIVFRDQFEILTADARLPADSSAIGTDFAYRRSAFPPSRGNYHQSSYVHYRYEAFLLNNGGPIKMMSQDAQQLIKAEGLYRLGRRDEAADIVNVTRVGRGGLPMASGSDPDLLDKLIYEYLIENYNICSGCSYFNKRGWGPLSDTRGIPPGTHHWGLVEGTPLHFPMPAEQLELAGQRFYSYGGVGNEGGSLSGAPPTEASTMPVVPSESVALLNSKRTLREKVELLQQLKRQQIAARLAAMSLTRH